MKYNILDSILSDPSYTLVDVVDILAYHIENEPPAVQKEIKEDLEHAFNG
jgi:hypothetical protein